MASRQGSCTGRTRAGGRLGHRKGLTATLRSNGMRIPTLVLAVPLLLLAGCADSGSQGEEADPAAPMGGHDGHGGVVAGTHLLAPTWKLGDHWTLSSPQGGTFTHAVSGDAGGDWIMDTDNADT